MPKNYQLNIGGSLLDLATPVVMGILNLTPDSFYDGGRLKNDKQLLNKAEEMLSSGAGILDFGGYSSRPGALDVDAEEEKSRVCNAIALIAKKMPSAVISIDTFRASVAKSALDSGAGIINDISAGNIEPEILDVAASHDVPYIAMHMQGTPQTMKEMVSYDDLIIDMLDFFRNKIQELRNKGIKDIIVDPGFGFSKTLKQNYELLGGLNLFEVLEVPILVGVSRKSMIYNALGTDPESALNGTTVINTLSIQNGASIIRVHDVKEAVEVVKLTQLLKN